MTEMLMYYMQNQTPHGGSGKQKKLAAALQNIEQGQEENSSLFTIQELLEKHGTPAKQAFAKLRALDTLNDRVNRILESSSAESDLPPYISFAKFLLEAGFKKSMISSGLVNAIGQVLKKCSGDAHLIEQCLELFSTNWPATQKNNDRKARFVFEKYASIADGAVVWSHPVIAGGHFWQASCEDDNGAFTFRVYSYSPMALESLIEFSMLNPQNNFGILYQEKRKHTFSQEQVFTEFDGCYGVEDVLKFAATANVLEIQIEFLSLKVSQGASKDDTLFTHVPEKYRKFLYTMDIRPLTTYNDQDFSTSNAPDTNTPSTDEPNTSNTTTTTTTAAKPFVKWNKWSKSKPSWNNNNKKEEAKTSTQVLEKPKYIPKHWGKTKIYKFGQKGEPFFPAEYEIKQHDVFLCTDIKTNSNKFYSLEYHVGSESDKMYYRLFTHYGRTDDLAANSRAGQRESRYFPSEEETLHVLQLITEDKLSDFKGYKRVELATLKVGSDKAQSIKLSNAPTSGHVVAAQSNLAPELQELVKYIYSEATTSLSNVCNATFTPHGIETPIGVLTFDQITKGQNILYKIYDAIELGGDDLTNELTTLSSDFYSLIPHKFGGRSRFDSAVIDSYKAVEDKLDLLQLMKDLLQVNGDGTVLYNNVVDMKYKALKCNIVPLAKGMQAKNINTFKESYEYRDIVKHAMITNELSNPMKVVNIFKVKRDAEYSSYTDSVHDQRLLFHGSKVSNFVGLLSRGLLLPHIVVKSGGKRTDAGFLGHGIYFASESTTSAKYASAGLRGTRFMLVCRVALGRIKDYTQKTFGITAPPEGYDSCRGVKRSNARPSDFTDDEYVVYKKQQQRLEYLIEFNMPDDAPASYVDQINAEEIEQTNFQEMYAPKKAVKETSESDDDDVAKAKPALKTKKYVKAYALATPAPALKTKIGITTESNVNLQLSDSPPLRINKKDYDLSLSTKEHSLAEMKKIEDNFRELFANDRKHPDLENPYLFLIDVYENREMFKYQEETPEELAIPKILTKERRLGREGYSANLPDNFATNWNEFTQSMFKGLDWNNVFIAGGAVLSNMVTDNDRGYKGSDIDMFFYNMSEEEANNKVKHVYEVVKRNTKSVGEEVTVIRTSNAVTLLGTYPHRHIQIVLRLYKSPAEVLIGFDIDSCCVGFDGYTVWSLPRARRAINKGFNLADLSRRSLTYEIRLFKYSKRGFAVAVPDLNRNAIDPLLFHKNVKEMNGLAKLLLFEHNINQGRSAYHFDYSNKKRLSKLMPRLADKENEDKLAEFEERAKLDPSDYSNYVLPWGPQWSSNLILRMLKWHDKAQMYHSKKHQHVFIYGIDAVVNGLKDTPPSTSFAQDEKRGKKEQMNLYHVDDSFKKPLSWLTENPGRQGLLTGSFHPLHDEKFFDNVYLQKSEETIQSLCNAAFCGDLDTIISMHQNQINVDEYDRQYLRTPLHVACIYGRTEVIRMLIEFGAEVNKRDLTQFGFTPLHFAVLNGHDDAVELLLQCGADVNMAEQRTKYSPLHMASYYNRHKVIQRLLEKGAKAEALDRQGRYPLHLAALANHFEVIVALMNANSSLSLTKHSAPSALELAIKRSLMCIAALVQPTSDDNVKQLLSHEYEQDRSELGIDSVYPLISLAGRGDKKELKKMVLNTIIPGQTPLEKDPANVTAIHIASRYNDVECLRILIEDGEMQANINVKDILNQTPLHYACKYGSNEACKYLIENGADIEAANIFGQTPLFYCLDTMGTFENHSNNVMEGFASFGSKSRYEQVRTYLEQNGAKIPKLLKAPSSNYSIPPLPSSVYLLEYPYRAPSHYQVPKPSSITLPAAKKKKAAAPQTYDTMFPQLANHAAWDTFKPSKEKNSKPEQNLTSKALMMATMLHKGQVIADDERILLKKIILSGQTRELFGSLREYEKSPNIGRLIRKWKKVLGKYRKMDEEDWFTVFVEGEDDHDVLVMDDKDVDAASESQESVLTASTMVTQTTDSA